MRILFLFLTMVWFVLTVSMFLKAIWIDTKPICDHFMNTGFLFLFMGIWIPLLTAYFWMAHEMNKGENG